MRWEHWWSTVPLRLRSMVRVRRVERELDEELQFHLDHKIEAGLANGLTVEEARYAALRAMQGLEQRKEEMRDMRRIHWLTDLIDDTRYAVRSLRRTPGLAAFVVLTLALGIGMTSAIFSMVDALIFRPYPVPHPSAVVTLVSTTHDNKFDAFSHREYLDVRTLTNSYDGVIANKEMEAVGFSAEAKATPRIKGGMLVSGNYFSVLGVEPQLGRSFRDDEDRAPGRDAVIVLGPDFWTAEFGRDRSVLGRRVWLNGKEFTIIGVAPNSFNGMGIFGHPDFYIPLAMARTFSTDRSKNFFEDRDDRELNLSARLKRGTTLQQAQVELNSWANAMQRAYPKANLGRAAQVHTSFEMRTRDDDGNWKFAIIFVVLAVAVLLVACANVAGLLLSRARTRTREIAVRLAIGAGRFRLLRLLMTENLMLASLGGLAGIAIGYGVIWWMHTNQSVIFMTELPLKIPFQMDARALVACLVLTFLSALLCGLAPALQSTRTDLVNGLKSGDVDLPGRQRPWARNVLVIAQISASLMLLTTALLMFRGFEHSLLGGNDFRKDHLLMTTFDPRLVQRNSEQIQQFYTQLAARVRETPGVRSEALTQNVPLGQDGFDAIAFVPEGVHVPRDLEHFTSFTDTIDEGYFNTMGVRLLRGRNFETSDTANSARVAIVNAQFAKHYWPGMSPLGKHIHLESRAGTPIEIVGVAQTIKYQSTGEPETDFVYLPLRQHPVARMVLLLQSNGDPLTLVKPVKQLVAKLDRNLPMLDTMPYAEYYRNQAVEGPGMATKLVSSLGLIGLLLAVAGLYGLVSYNVSRRTREIGIRMAIGAGRSDVLRLVMSNGLALVGIGTMIGLGLGFAVEHLINSVLFSGGGVDAAAYLVVVPFLVLITAFAAYVPARRATQIAPTQALRFE